MVEILTVNRVVFLLIDRHVFRMTPISKTERQQQSASNSHTVCGGGLDYIHLAATYTL